MVTAAALLLCQAHAGAADAALTGAQVTTAAGSGRLGLGDGPAARASFVLPVGIAEAPDGSVYIADQAAQRIRMLRNGAVETIAGSGPLGPDGLSVHGGFRDGPALQAQFALIAGLAVGPDGALYIADSLNACVRKLDHGVVSTVVGKPKERAAIDGDAATARLIDPRALAFDSTGALYIADFGGGLRKWSAGRLTSPGIKTTDPQYLRLLGVAVNRSGDGSVVAATTPWNLLTFDPETGVESLVDLRGESRPFGHPDAIAAIGRREFLFTDTQMGAVRYLRLSAKPYTTTVYSRIIAGAGLERPADNAGFRDGVGPDVRFFLPAGIAVGAGSVFVSDAGNRRIRRLVLPPVARSEADAADAVPTAGNHYEIAYVGGADVFWDSLGEDSFCAHLAKDLNDSGTLRRSARCHPIRLDGITPGGIRDYVSRALAPRRMDLLILGLSAADIPGGDVPDLRFAIQGILDALKPTQTKLAIIWNPAGRPNEATVRATSLAAQRALGDLGVPQYDPSADYLTYSRTPNAVGFVNADDKRPTPSGNALLADFVSKWFLRQPAGTFR